MQKVTIIQIRLFHYRVPLFEHLKRRLEEENIALRVAYGEADVQQSSRQDVGELEWGLTVPSRWYRWRSVECVWQSCLDLVKDSDLTIVMQESRCLLNYLLFAQRRKLPGHLAFWGHGRNFQSLNPHGLRECWKKLWLTSPDWWFAYTDLTKDILLKAGYPPERITVLNNAVDTSSIRAWGDSISGDEIAALRRRLNIRGLNVGVYCGSLYDHKKIGFLLEAAERIRERVSDFELVIIGAGPDQSKVQQASSRAPWIHYVGPQRDRDKVLHMKLGRVFLNPGLVGLAILDAFALGLPLFTTKCRVHSPEICYLEDGVNGFITEESVDTYCAAVVQALGSNGRLTTVSRKCQEVAGRYTIEDMARRFSAGIMAALGCPSATDAARVKAVGLERGTVWRTARDSQEVA
jgi:glycosyltransferase involved in cell wall biosynthesis